MTIKSPWQQREGHETSPLQQAINPSRQKGSISKQNRLKATQGKPLTWPKLTLPFKQFLFVFIRISLLPFNLQSSFVSFPSTIKVPNTFCNIYLNITIGVPFINPFFLIQKDWEFECDQNICNCSIR